MRSRIVEFLINTFDSSIFHYIVPTGTILYVTAMLMVLVLLVRRSDKVNLSPYHILGASIYGMVFGILGARFFYLLQNIESTLDQPLRILSLSGGTVSWGAYTAGTIAFVTYFYIKKIPILPYLDVLFSALAIGPFIARWACFFNGCCFGTITDLSWGVCFPKDSSAFLFYAQSGMLQQTDKLTMAIHPVQIYSSICALVIFIVVSIFWEKYWKIRGATFIFYLLLYGTSRFIIEFFRGDVPRYSVFSLTLAQMICISIISGVLFILVIKKRSIKNFIDNRIVDEKDILN